MANPNLNDPAYSRAHGVDRPHGGGNTASDAAMAARIPAADTRSRPMPNSNNPDSPNNPFSTAQRDLAVQAMGGVLPADTVPGELQPAPSDRRATDEDRTVPRRDRPELPPQSFAAKVQSVEDAQIEQAKAERDFQRQEHIAEAPDQNKIEEDRKAEADKRASEPSEPSPNSVV